jgi:hypothetical protein
MGGCVQGSQLTATTLPTPLSRAYRCRCGRQVFFRNSRCLACDTPLGYVPSRGSLYPLQPGGQPGGPPDTWRITSPSVAAQALPAAEYRRCANFHTAAACNWLIEPEAGASPQPLCKACRLNRTIPDLSQSRNPPLWLSMERAKRRLVSQLVGLGLPVASKVTEDPKQGLAYDFLSSMPGQPRVMTGYAHGVITINVEEADDAVRERTRVEMGEPYRTLLGHFRHEVGHYYWERLIAGTGWQDACRGLFGDERRDYGAALKANYQNGAPSYWRQRFVSSYASIHPSEDWAESWAHYLHLRDTLDTAASFGIESLRVDLDPVPFSVDDLWQPEAPGAAAFVEMLHRWIRITRVMNEMSRAMGQHDFYPFVLPRCAVAKLHFIHAAVASSQHAVPRAPELA